MDFLSVPQEDREAVAGVLVSLYNEEKDASMLTLQSESNGFLYFLNKKNEAIYLDDGLDNNKMSELSRELDLLSSVYQKLVMAEQYVEYTDIKQNNDDDVFIVDDTEPPNPGPKFVDAVKSLGDVKPTAMLSTLISSSAGEKFATALKSVVWISCTLLVAGSRLLVSATNILGQALAGTVKVFGTTVNSLFKNLGVKGAEKFAARAASTELAVTGVFQHSAVVVSSLSSQLAIPVIVTMLTGVYVKATQIAAKNAASRTGFFPLRCLPSRVNNFPAYADKWSATVDCNDDNPSGHAERDRKALGIGYFSSLQEGNIASWYGYDGLDYLLPSKNTHYHPYPASFCFPSSKRGKHMSPDTEKVNWNRFFNDRSASLFYQNQDYVIPFASESSATVIKSVMFDHDGAVVFNRLDDGLLFQESANAWRHTLANFCGFKAKAGAEFTNALVLEDRAGKGLSGKDADIPRTYINGDYGHVTDFYARKSTTFIDVPKKLRGRLIDLPCCYSTLICFFSRCFTLVSEYVSWLYNTMQLLYWPPGDAVYTAKNAEQVNSETESLRNEMVRLLHKHMGDEAEDVICSFDNTAHYNANLLADNRPDRNTWYRDLSYLEGLVSRFVIFYNAFMDYVDVADEFLFTGFKNEKLKRKVSGVLSSDYGERSFHVCSSKGKEGLPSFPFRTLKGRFVDCFEFFKTLPYNEYETVLNDFSSVDQTYELFKNFDSDARDKMMIKNYNFGVPLVQYTNLIYQNLYKFLSLLQDKSYASFYRNFLKGQYAAR